jgi:ABC-type dipeptide/oligopeptide/nickel transport system permease subunit
MATAEPSIPDPYEPPVTPQGVELTPVLRSRGLWRDALRSTMRTRSAQVGAVLLSLLVVLAVFAPLIAPYGPNEVLLGTGVKVREKPCIHLFGCDKSKPQHIAGIDGNGRDEFSRLVYGARVSLLSGLAAVAVALVIGTILGLVSGFYGRWSDNVIMRCMDVLLAFPALLLAITIVTVLGRGLTNAIIAIALVSIPVYARIVRSSVLTIREQDFVAADRALGVSSWRVLWHRVFPNCLTPLVVQATLGIATAVLEVASLSFLGLGVQPPTAEWGSMLAAERNQVFSSLHLVLFPGIMIMINVLAFNLLGDGLRDALDPRLNK